MKDLSNCATPPGLIRVQQQRQEPCIVTLTSWYSAKLLSPDSKKKHVSFMYTDEVHHVLHKEDMTAEEKAACWLTPVELFEIRQGAKEFGSLLGLRMGNSRCNVIGNMNEKYDRVMESVRARHNRVNCMNLFDRLLVLDSDFDEKETGSEEEPTAINDIDEQEEDPVWFADDCLEEWTCEYTDYRGLESYASKHVRHVRGNKMYAYTQTMIGIPNDIALRNAQSIALQARVWARVMAEADAQAAREVYNLTETGKLWEA